MPQNKLRVGFDLDGVILYNPARVVRPLVVGMKKVLPKKDPERFYYPKSKLQKIVWLLLHRSSLFPSSGVEDIKRLVKDRKIEAYIITARYESLKRDFYKWLDKIDAGKAFKGAYYNIGDAQPYLFKEHKIKELKLDYFFEDNWDIVKHLRKSCKKTKIIWITNLIDNQLIKYPYKFLSLKKALVRIFPK